MANESNETLIWILQHKIVCVSYKTTVCQSGIKNFLRLRCEVYFGINCLMVKLEKQNICNYSYSMEQHIWIQYKYIFLHCTFWSLQNVRHRTRKKKRQNFIRRRLRRCNGNAYYRAIGSLSSIVFTSNSIQALILRTPNKLYRSSASAWMLNLHRLTFVPFVPFVSSVLNCIFYSAVWINCQWRGNC